MLLKPWQTARALVWLLSNIFGARTNHALLSSSSMALAPPTTLAFGIDLGGITKHRPTARIQCAATFCTQISMSTINWVYFCAWPETSAAGLHGVWWQQTAGRMTAFSMHSRWLSHKLRIELRDADRMGIGIVTNEWPGDRNVATWLTPSPLPAHSLFRSM